jgi:hypothetical protein
MQFVEATPVAYCGCGINAMLSRECNVPQPIRQMFRVEIMAQKIQSQEPLSQLLGVCKAIAGREYSARAFPVRELDVV